MSQNLHLRILGSGCSTGVPRIDGYWGACDPHNPKNRRTRCSLWLGLHEENTPDKLTSVVVDTSPEFREQMIRAGVRHLDAVLWTHDHADQTHGIDDMRAYTFGREGVIDGYMDVATHATLTSRFGYIFEGKFGYPPICAPHIIPAHGTKWGLAGEGGVLPAVTFDQAHGPIRSVGYRFGPIAYSSDVSDIPEDSFAALSGLKVWIVDALRIKPHPTHAHLEKALQWAERLRPELTILTNLHQDMDYEALRTQLPPRIVPAYDQMEVRLQL
ncbi:MBL fold metallo-hydrolase [Asticcacaulis sp. EMRT-3]|uniref:MBL fold metallo-hydrolase n=1 Tax=Asticcacaulis sp. EMRT-3 TaxID=3040349 RepID=UPI0024AEFE9C|nr:MBL fold metallo-hydrolase [Asticcacaulis sp. EMRT-3]MDI7774495.1 MBL fold metallo-hydrolase [Asticcacaulis sp. EMRT-3]